MLLDTPSTNKRWAFGKLAVFAGIVISLVACSSPNETPGSPSYSLRRFVELANSGSYSEVPKHLSVPARAFLESDAAASEGGVRAYVDQFTSNQTIVSYRTIHETVTGNEAVVVAWMRYRNGETYEGPIALVREDGEWRIALYSPEGGDAWLNEEDVAK